MALKITPTFEIPTSELEFSYSRSSGPGGQKVNKSNTKVTLKWNLEYSQGPSDMQRDRMRKKLTRKLNEDGEIVVQSDRFRDRGRNTADCIEKLVDWLQTALKRQKKRIATKPTKASKVKRLEGKRQRSETKKNRKKVDY